ncbi:ribosome maturation factor RimM [Chelativorans sp. YIM 93263]|uniref:ribosome maturation factor RimM n=1 Tax=Chelativorans sp. YIM 93263 TaxID=2906648 RepID=UPI00237920E6|nr:ribosome maturation factor RimM [Chelativorans sp. YIM 93263]
MPKPKNPIQLGIVGAAHGIRGEVRVKPYTEDPAALGDYGPLYTADGRMLVLKNLRPSKGGVIARFEGIGDRNAAEGLNGEELFVDRSALPEDLDEEEFYHADIIGLTAIDETGTKLGKVVAIHDFGAGDLLEVRPASGQTLMIPFTREAVPEIDVPGGQLHVDGVAAGLDEGENPEDRKNAAGDSLGGGNGH